MLDLVRHGEAERDGPAGDASRPLSVRGAAALRALGERLAREGWRPRRTLSSPLLRARQSLEILIAAAGVPSSPEVLSELAPDRDPAVLLRALEAHGVVEGEALLIGHQPLLGELAHLLSGRPVQFEPGTLVRIACSSPPGSGVGSSRIERTLHPSARL